MVLFRVESSPWLLRYVHLTLKDVADHSDIDLLGPKLFPG